MKWVLCNSENFKDEDWAYKHYRYASDKIKLDTDLFEIRDGALMKIGGTGRLDFNEVEILIEYPESFLSILTENYQAQIAGYYNVDKTIKDKEKRNAVIEEYKDLIAIYKSKF